MYFEVKLGAGTRGPTMLSEHFIDGCGDLGDMAAATDGESIKSEDRSPPPK